MAYGRSRSTGPKKFFGKHPRTKAQKRGKMHTVMGEFKRGALRSGTGRKGQKGGKVTSREQAIAIGLKESGQSKYDKKRG